MTEFSIRYPYSMSKKKKMSGILLLRHDVQKLIIEPLVSSVKTELQKIRSLQEKALEKLAHQEKLIDAIAHEVKRQADSPKN